VHGRWTLETNPYCVTDRFYDQLVLEAYPRLQTKLVEDEEMIMQKVNIILQCRLSGHFTAGRLHFKDRQNYAKGKISHGVLFLERDGNETKKHWWHQPRIAASFSARRLITSKTALTSQIGIDDETEFGY
jgi:hypothetical protein